MKKLLYLYREIMPYNIPVLRVLVELGYGIKVIHKFSKRKTSYVPPKLSNVEFIDETEFSKKSLKKYALKYNPDLCFICDWSMQKYNFCGAILRKSLNIPVVVGCDTQWKGGKQWLNVISSNYRHHRYFSHILVAGVRQYEYAKKIGFKNNQILMNLYSADLDQFKKNDITRKQFKGKRDFLFVGRFVEVKGVRLLLDAWNSIEKKNGSNLIMIGEGKLKSELQFPADVQLYPFMSQDGLLKYAQSSCCFILPSIFEPWALVIQEFAAAGLPLIVSDSCGATPHFVINKYNGFVVPSGSVAELKNAIKSIIELSDQELFEYAKRSRQLSEKINPDMVAHSLTSVL